MEPFKAAVSMKFQMTDFRPMEFRNTGLTDTRPERARLQRPLSTRQKTQWTGVFPESARTFDLTLIAI